MRSMRITLPLLTVDPLLEMSLNRSLNCTGVPDILSHWLCMKTIPTISCVQDIVHVRVKLKAHFLKPSIVLPIGNYIATKAHFQMIVKLYGKEKHGLRTRDIDHRDKQNFDAVGHLIKASYLLDDLPDAVGTNYYINVMKSVVDSYLDKSLSPKQRIEEAWYAVFFLRYWRQWILQHPNFTLQKNFISSNAYMCVEINAHSLIAMIFLLRDKMDATSDCFCLG